jgi:hypothetical protein
MTVFLDKDRTMDNVQKHNICIHKQVFNIEISYMQYLEIEDEKSLALLSG